VLVLGMLLGSGTSGNRHFRFFLLVVSGTSCLVFLRLLDSFTVVLLFVLVDRDKRSLFPSDTLADIKKSIISN